MFHLAVEIEGSWKQVNEAARDELRERVAGLLVELAATELQ